MSYFLPIAVNIDATMDAIATDPDLPPVVVLLDLADDRQVALDALAAWGDSTDPTGHVPAILAITDEAADRVRAGDPDTLRAASEEAAIQAVMTMLLGGA